MGFGIKAFVGYGVPPGVVAFVDEIARGELSLETSESEERERNKKSQWELGMNVRGQVLPKSAALLLYGPHPSSA